MRLIDADRFKDIISDTWILDRIDEQPTVPFIDISALPIVDNYEIVRCKDCKFCKTWYFDKDGEYLWAICTFWNEGSRVDGIDVYKDGFCSNGKRRIDDETG